MTLLWDDREPIGICVFTTPPMSLRQRNRFFGLSGRRWARVRIRALNEQLITLSRVVLHPTYRGAGLAAAFIRRSCQSCRWPWVESLAQMGHIHPFFEKAGFQRVGITSRKSNTIEGHSALYGARRKGHEKQLVSKETFEKSQYAEPVYYVFDNRKHKKHTGGTEEREDADA